MLSVPYIIVLTILLIFGNSLGYNDFYFPSLWIWIIGLCLFWLPSPIFFLVFMKETNKRNNLFRPLISENLERNCHIISYILILMLFVGLSKSSQKGSFGSEEFEQDFGSGIVAHISIISKFFFIFLLVNYKKKYILPILLFFLVYFLYGAKSWILIPILAAVLIRIILNRNKFSLKLLVSIFLIGVLVFYFVYFLSIGPDMPIDFIFSHFLSYLFSGILGLSEYIRSDNFVQLDPQMLINPIVNLYNKITGNDIINTYSNLNTDIGNGAEVNVMTLFGTIYLYGGIFMGAIFVLVLSFIYYSFLILSVKSNHIILQITYFTLVALLLFGWFDTYTSNLFFYEFSLFGFIFWILNLRFFKYSITSK